MNLSNVEAQEGTPSTTAPNKSVVELLRFEFSSRSQRNARYSLRSFAQNLGVSHALLSLVMNEKRRPSKAFIEKICEKIGIDPQQKKNLLGETKNRVSKPVEYNKLNLDQYALMAEWQHFAILSLLEIADTNLTPEFIAKRLNISEGLARISLKRLFDLDLLEKNEKTGKWQQKSGPIVVENTISTATTRKFQAQLIQKSLESLENDPIEIRDHSSMTFAMDSKNIPYALRRIRAFRRELTRELEELGEKNEVYNLTVQIFPTSKRGAL